MLRDCNLASGKLASKIGTNIRVRLSECSIEQLPDNKSEQKHYILGFDSSQVVGRYHIIVCEDQFTKDFIISRVAKIDNGWEVLGYRLLAPECQKSCVI